jgi:hypothetical protein
MPSRTELDALDTGTPDSEAEPGSALNQQRLLIWPDIADPRVQSQQPAVMKTQPAGVYGAGAAGPPNSRVRTKCQAAVEQIDVVAARE